ncbi:MAG: hypothetical protein K9J85_07920 [Desulfobacteraceae bacterium]|nr:hypothetical protein [Desulfobacteraceae bacterium]
MKSGIAIVFLAALLFIPAGFSALSKPIPKSPDTETGLVRLMRSGGVPGLYPPKWRDNRLFFSGYSKHGGFDIFEMDPVSGRRQMVVSGVKGARWVARNDKYLAVCEEQGGSGDLLALYDRKTGDKIAQVKHKSPVKWGGITDGRMVVISGSRKSKTEAVFFSLPDLRMLESKKIDDFNEIRSWKDNYVAAGMHITVYDRDFKEIARSEKLHKTGLERGAFCESGPLRICGNKAVVSASCGDIFIYSLPALILENVIPSFCDGPALAAGNGLVFAAPRYQQGKQCPTRVFDLNTGQLLSVLPVEATELFAADGKIIAFVRRPGEKAEVKTYEYDAERLRDRQRRLNEVRRAYEKASGIMEQSADLYKALDVLDLSPARGLVKEDKLPEDVIDILFQYGLWLSKSYDQYEQAKPVFRFLEKHVGHEGIDPYLTVIGLKEKIMRGDCSLQSIGEQSLQTPFGRKLALGSPDALKQKVDFGAFPGLFKFYGDKIYIGRRGRRKGHSHIDSAVCAAVLDRKTLSPVRQTDIVPYDSEYQDYIRDIAIDDSYIYVSLGYRQGYGDRINFAVLDRKSLAVLEKLHIDSFMDVRIAGPPYFFNPKMFCSTFDRDTIKKRDLYKYECVGGKFVPVRYIIKQGRELEPATATENYLVVDDTSPTGRDVFRFYHMREKREPITFDAHSGYNVVSLPGRDEVLLKGFDQDTISVSLFDIPDRENRNIIRLKSVFKRRTPVAAAGENHIFIGYGRDLIIIDIDRQEVVKYICGFIEEGFADNGNGSDANQIVKIFIDKNRLIALTLSGVNSRIAELENLAE